MNHLFESRITPRHIQLAVGNDNELNKLFDNVIISQGGVLPGINVSLLPNGTKVSSNKSIPVNVIGSQGY